MPIRYQLRSPQQRASNIELLRSGNSNGSGQFPSVVRPVQVSISNQRRSERSISPIISSNDSNTSMANESIDNCEISNDEVGVTTIGELFPIIRMATKRDKTRFKLFKYDSEITLCPEENCFKNWWQ